MRERPVCTRFARVRRIKLRASLRALDPGVPGRTFARPKGYGRSGDVRTSLQVGWGWPQDGDIDVATLSLLPATAGATRPTTGRARRGTRAPNARPAASRLRRARTRRSSRATRRCARPRRTPSCASSTSSARSASSRRSWRRRCSPRRRSPTRATWCAAATSRTSRPAAWTCASASPAPATCAARAARRSARRSHGARMSTPRRPSSSRTSCSSASHRSIITDRRFRDIGVGLALGAPLEGMGTGATLALNFGRR